MVVVINALSVIAIALIEGFLIYCAIIKSLREYNVMLHPPEFWYNRIFSTEGSLESFYSAIHRSILPRQFDGLAICPES